MTLKRCPCGQIPSQLHITYDDVRKWNYVSGDCCGEWEVEFRSGYVTGDALKRFAKHAWNRAKRASVLETSCD